MNTNRIDQILAEVREEVTQRRATGKYGPGYEAAIENAHDQELGKVAKSSPENAVLLARLSDLRLRIGSISTIERDKAKFPLLRFVRELAMSRHQLIRLSAEVRSIAESFDVLVSELVASETARNSATTRAAHELLDVVYERTQVLERLIVVSRELEDRLSALEKH